MYRFKIYHATNHCFFSNGYIINLANVHYKFTHADMRCIRAGHALFYILDNRIIIMKCVISVNANEWHGLNVIYPF